MKLLFFLLPMVVLIQLTGCIQPNNNETFPTQSCVADTIVYDVTIKAPNAYDEYSIGNLKYLKRKLLVDELFEAVYSGKAKAFDYYDHTPLSSDDVKLIEEGQPRDLVGRLQFTETWYYTPKNTLFQKKVHSVLIAYERQEENGEVRFYKAGFMIELD